MSESDFFPLPPSQLGGAIAVNVFAILSTVALISVALRISWLAVRHFWIKSATQSQESVFFHTQLGQYAACLIVAMMFNTIAGIIGLPWLIRRGITPGSMCSSQAFLMQFGNFSAGYFTVSIAVHTFNSLVLRKRQSAFICRSTICCGWLLAGLIAGAPFLIHLPDGPVYGPDGLLCDVRTIYPKLQFFFHLLPIFLASILSAVMYSVIFLALRGTLSFKGGIKVSLNPNGRWSNSNQGLCEKYHRFILQVGKSMLWYPVAYIALLVPYAIMRLLVISGFTVSFEAMIFAFVCWYSLGVVDVLLLYNTFRVLGPAFDGRSAITSKVSRRETESFGSSAMEKYSVSSKLSPMDEKMGIFAAQGVLPYRSGSPTSILSSSSTKALLPLHYDRNIPDPTVGGLRSPFVVGPPISPGYVISSPPPVAAPTFAGRQLSQLKLYPSDSPSEPSPRQQPSPTFGRPSPGDRPGAINPSPVQQVSYPQSPPLSATMDRSRSPQAYSPRSGPRPLLTGRGSPTRF